MLAKNNRFPSYVKHGGLRGLTNYQPKYKCVKQSLSDILRESSDSDARLKDGSHLRNDTKFPIHHSPSCYTAPSEQYKTSTSIASLTESRQ